MMKRTTPIIEQEIHEWQMRRIHVLNLLQTKGGYLSDSQLHGYKTLLADYEASISSLTQELNQLKQPLILV